MPFLYLPELRKSTIREVEKKIEDAKLIVSVALKQPKKCELLELKDCLS